MIKKLLSRLGLLDAEYISPQQRMKELRKAREKRDLVF